MKIYIPPEYEQEFERIERERLANRNRLYDPWMEPNARNLLRLYIIGKMIIFYRKLQDLLNHKK